MFLKLTDVKSGKQIIVSTEKLDHVLPLDNGNTELGFEEIPHRLKVLHVSESVEHIYRLLCSSGLAKRS